MGTVVRAAAYVPRWGPAERATLGPDEDAFTLAASAVERVVAGALPLAGPVAVEIVGPEGAVEAGPGAGFASLLGPETRARSRPPGPGALFAAVGQAVDGRTASIVVAVQLGRAGEASGAGAAAFLVLPGEGEPAGLLPPDPARGSAEPWADAIAWSRVRPGAESDRWVGDWSPTHPRLSPSAGSGPDSPSAAVSEGAYVPRPRYLESLPSRWWFVGERCGACASVGFPQRGRCRSCGRADRLEPERLPLDGGTVVATTWIGRGGQPTEFDRQVDATGPYGVALVEIAPGVRATLQMTDCAPGELRIGDRVGTRLRRIYSLEGEWRYGRKAVPIETHAP